MQDQFCASYITLIPIIGILVHAPQHLGLFDRSEPKNVAKMSATGRILPFYNHYNQIIKIPEMQPLKM
jgi:hypothetical protein